MLDFLYAEAARWRRRSVERRPDLRRRLARPVISVGNLSVGGTGKTPVVAALAAWLVARGERPAILSRGYRRRDDVPGVVVVSDGEAIRSGLDSSGDEPLMLARAVPGAIVCVCPDRYLAGGLAERALGASVHLLDDGFQHLALARDLDVLVTSMGEITDGRVLPVGRLREPADAAARAHVLVVMGATAGAASSEAWTLGVALACGTARTLGEPIPIGNRDPGTGNRPGESRRLDTGSRIVIATGIANPSRFADDAKAAGWQVARALDFPDHHPFSARDIARMGAALSETGAAAVVTTDKDAVRFEAAGRIPFPLFRVPLTIAFDPPGVLFDSMAAVLERPADGNRQAADGRPVPASPPVPGPRFPAPGDGP